MSEAACGYLVIWWDGEYEGNCELPAGHEGDHFDGISWFDDELNDTGHRHEESKCEWCGEPSKGTAIQDVMPYAVRLSCGRHGIHFVALEDEQDA